MIWFTFDLLFSLSFTIYIYIYIWYLQGGYKKSFLIQFYICVSDSWPLSDENEKKEKNKKPNTKEEGILTWSWCRNNKKVSKKLICLPLTPTCSSRVLVETKLFPSSRFVHLLILTLQHLPLNILRVLTGMTRYSIMRCLRLDWVQDR